MRSTKKMAALRARRRPRRQYARRVRRQGRHRQVRGRHQVQDRHAGQPRLVRRLRRGAQGVHRADRLHGQGPQERRRGRGPQPGDPHQGLPARRRVLRRRQHPALARPRPRDLHPVRGQGPGRRPAAVQLDKGEHRVTPIDTGDICVNYDKKYFADKKLSPPSSFADLIKPEYKNLLVTENAATSSPGLGFLLGTAAQYGDEGWQDYWKKLKDNGVKVVDGWEQAYNQDFSGSAERQEGQGERPLVVSYASSPPVEVLYAKPQPTEAPTGVATGTCFRQTEFAGLLKGAKNEAGGKALLDFLISKKFQEDMPLNMFVNPVAKDAKLPELFTKFGATVTETHDVAPEKISKNREQWVKTWSSLVLK